MADEAKRGGVGPTEEVGDEGGGTGDLEIERTELTTGSESTSTVIAHDTQVEERRRDRDRRTP